MNVEDGVEKLLLHHSVVGNMIQTLNLYNQMIHLMIKVIGARLEVTAQRATISMGSIIQLSNSHNLLVKRGLEVEMVIEREEKEKR